MKLRLLALLSAALAFTALARAEHYPFTEPFSRTGAFAAAGELSLENVNGDVTVRTWDKNEILIEGEKRARSADELAAIDLKIELSPDRAGVKVKLPKRPGAFGNTIRAAVTFTITLPRSATIAKLDTVNASVKIEGLDGAIRAETVNGGITVIDAGGNIHLETVNGGIRLNASRPPGSGCQIHTETVNGRIVIALPRATGAELKAEVVNGHIACAFPLTLHRGGIGKRHLEATIGAGGAAISAETVNGNIDIQSI